MAKPRQAGEEAPRFYFYKMTVDNGGAPCSQEGLLSLAICKPTIRRTAPEGSIIIGFAGEEMKSEGYKDNSIVYAAEITRTLKPGKASEPSEYYSKRIYAARPDCIYKRLGRRLVRKRKALFHDEDDREHDVGKYPDYKNSTVLLSEEAKNFRYFGKLCPVQYKNEFPLLKEEVESLARGHRVNHSAKLYEELRRLKKRLWKERSCFSHTPVPAKPDSRCDWDDYAVECDGR